MSSILPRTFDSFAFNYKEYIGPTGPQGPTGPAGPQGPEGSIDKGYSFSDVTSASYNALTTDYLIGVSYTVTGAVGINLPQVGSVGKKIYVIVDKGGNAAVNNITITALGGDLINGSPTAVISTNYDSVMIINDGISGWYII